MKEFQELFNSIGERLNFKKGERIFSEGEKTESFYYIEKGSAEVFISEDEKEKILAVLGEGEIFGEMTLFEDVPASANVRIREPSIIIKIRKEKFYEFMKEKPLDAFSFTKKIVNVISSRLRIMNKFLIEIFNFSLDLFNVKKEEELSNTIMNRVLKCVNDIEKAILFFWNRFNQEYNSVLHYNWKREFPVFEKYEEDKIIKFFNKENAYVFPIGKEEINGFLYIESKRKLKEEEKILISTLSYLCSPVLSNIWYNEEQLNLERLKRNKGI